MAVNELDEQSQAPRQRVGGPAWDQPGADPLGDMLAWVEAFEVAARIVEASE